MSQLPTPEEAGTPLGFAGQGSRIKTAGVANLDAAKLMVLRGRAGVPPSEEGPSVTSHWGQATTATFTKANSPEEQSTSPVAVDYFIMTIRECRDVPFGPRALHRIHTAAHKRSWRHDMLNRRNFWSLLILRAMRSHWARR